MYASQVDLDKQFIGFSYPALLFFCAASVLMICDTMSKNATLAQINATGIR